MNKTCVKPDYCCIVLTDNCVLHCRMCRMWENRQEPPEQPDISQWKKFIISLRDFVGLPFEISLAGGEPFLEKNIFDIISLCRDTGFTTSVTSNGYLIDEAVSKKIASCGLNRIGLSLESLNEDTHDFLRGTKGACRKAKQALANLESSSGTITIDVCTVIMNQNLDDILDLVNWVQDSKRLLAITFQALMPPLASQAPNDWYKQNSLWPDDFKKLDSLVDKLIDLKAEGFKISNKISQLRIFKEYYKSPENYARNSDCHIDEYALNVNPKGEIFLCFSKEKIGNINDNLSRLWNSRKSEDVRREIKNCKQNCHFLINCCYKE